MIDKKKKFIKKYQAKSAIELLKVQENMPSFGYQVNNFQHSLQAATMALNANEDEELIVCTLFHDIGFYICGDNHGEFAAKMLANYISEKNYFLLKHHQYFLDFHAQTHPKINKHSRDIFKNNVYFEYTANWVEKYDMNSIRSDYDSAPLEYFETMIYKFFEKTSKGKILTD